MAPSMSGCEKMSSESRSTSWTSGQRSRITVTRKRTSLTSLPAMATYLIRSRAIVVSSREMMFSLVAADMAGARVGSVSRVSPVSSSGMRSRRPTLGTGGGVAGCSARVLA